MSEFFISDFHFFHLNILKYEKSRKNITEKVLIENFNKKVSKNDVTYILGDVFCGVKDFFKKNNLIFSKKLEFELQKSIINSLNGKKILILGNHDNLSKKEYLKMGFEEVYYLKILKRNGLNLLLSHYPVNDKYLKTFLNFKKDFDKTFFKEIQKIKKNPFGKLKFDYNLHGHLHSRNLSNKKYINVSVENIDFSPKKLNELLCLQNSSK